MRRRVDKAHRILEVQRQLHHIETWKLSQLQHRLEELELSQQELIGCLNDDAALQGVFIDALARRLRRLAEETARIGQDRDAQAVRVAERAAQALCAEKLCEGLDQEDARAEAKARLLDILERQSRIASD
jgi:uncharacterized coiled-coil protein SlyX